MKPTRHYKIRHYKIRKNRDEKTFVDRLPLNIRAPIKDVNDAIKTPIISISIFVFYFILLSFYANYRHLNYFDLLNGIGLYAWVIGAIFLLFLLYFGMIFNLPLLNINLLNDKRHVQTTMVFYISPSIIMYNIIVMNYLNMDIANIFLYISIFTAAPFIIFLIFFIKNKNTFSLDGRYIYILSIPIAMMSITIINIAMVEINNSLFIGYNITVNSSFILFLSELIYILIEILLLKLRRINKIAGHASIFSLIAILVLFIYPGGIATGDAILRFLGYGGNIPSQFVGEAGPFCNERLIKFVEDKTLCTKNGIKEISTVPVNVLLITRTAIYFVDSAKSNDTQPRLGEETASPIVISRRIVSAILPVPDKTKPSP